MNKSISTNDGGPVRQPQYEQTPDDVFNAQLSQEMIKRTAKLMDTSIDLAIRTKEAREFLAWSTSHMRQSWLDWEEQSRKVGQDVTMFRMAFDRETKAVIAAGKDVRDFFNSQEYLNSHAILLEMVTLMERFAKFKADGTLDAFADFILKVSCKS